MGVGVGVGGETEKEEEEEREGWHWRRRRGGGFRERREKVGKPWEVSCEVMGKWEKGVVVLFF